MPLSEYIITDFMRKYKYGSPAGTFAIMLMKEVRTHGVRFSGVTSDSKKQLFFLCSAGLVAGLINGLIGTGGGIIIIYALSYFKRRRRGAYLDTEPGGDIRDMLATAVASILPISAVSALFYSFTSAATATVSSDTIKYAVYIVPAACGGICGAALLDTFNSSLIKKIFSVLVVWAGVSMILKEAGVM